MKKLTILLCFTSLSLVVQAGKKPGLKPLSKGSFGVGVYPSVGLRTRSRVNDSFTFNNTGVGFGLSATYAPFNFLTGIVGVGISSSQNKTESESGAYLFERKTSGSVVSIQVGTPLRVFTGKKAVVVLSPNSGINAFSGKETTSGTNRQNRTIDIRHMRCCRYKNG